MVTESELLDAVGRRFDLLIGVRSHNAPEGFDFEFPFRVALERTREAVRFQLLLSVRRVAAQVLATTPADHDADLIAGGLINSFLAISFRRLMHEESRGTVDVAQIQQTLIETHYSDGMVFQQSPRGGTVASIPVQEQERAKHLAWCKARALEYVERGDLPNAFASMQSDLSKHEGTRQHVAIELFARLFFAGHLSTAQAMGDFIKGFN